MVTFAPFASFTTVLVLPVTGSTSLTGKLEKRSASAPSSSSWARTSAAMRSASALTSSGPSSEAGGSRDASSFFASAFFAAYSFSREIFLALHCCSATNLSNRTSLSIRSSFASKSASSGSLELSGWSLLPLPLAASCRGRWISNNFVLVSRYNGRSWSGSISSSYVTVGRLGDAGRGRLFLPRCVLELGRGSISNGVVALEPEGVSDGVSAVVSDQNMSITEILVSAPACDLGPVLRPE